MTLNKLWKYLECAHTCAFSLKSDIKEWNKIVETLKLRININSHLKYTVFVKTLSFFIHKEEQQNIIECAKVYLQLMGQYQHIPCFSEKKAFIWTAYHHQDQINRFVKVHRKYLGPFLPIMGLKAKKKKPGECLFFFFIFYAFNKFWNCFHCICSVSSITPKIHGFEKLASKISICTKQVLLAC